MNQELIRLVDGLARDRNINRDVILDDLEAAMLSAIRKANPESGDDGIEVVINRQTGDIKATVDGVEMSVRALGRIAAQTAKQVIIQRIRDAERGSIYEEYLEMRGQIVTGKAVRWEGGSLVVELGRVEALMPRSEQIPGETHRVDERLRAMVLDVKEHPSQVKIILSRTHPDFIRSLFDLEVPEVAEGIIEVKALAREAGYRTKVAVNSLDAKVDAVGACVGVRGSRIKNIVEELGGEKIDIVRWNESSKTLIANSLRPAEVSEIALCFELGRATVVVNEDQLSLAIGKRGQNVRLGARLTGWDIDILTPGEFNNGLDVLEKALRKIDGINTSVVDQVIAMGMVNVLDVEEVGAEALINSEQGLGLEAAVAQSIVIACAEEARRVAAEKEQAKKDAAAGADAKKKPKSEAAEPVEPAAAEVAEVAEETPAADVAVEESVAEVAEEAPAPDVCEEPTAAVEDDSTTDGAESAVSDETDDKNE
ncbi:MAG: transcription termination/antitermination protein NusA [Phycisphaerales bacterium]|jgi:transcription termination/antitermination protein NusA|nr:transcription termination/antitermination protein NusA [Phycisphaerales bacterium]